MTKTKKKSIHSQCFANADSCPISLLLIKESFETFNRCSSGTYRQNVNRPKHDTMSVLELSEAEIRNLILGDKKHLTFFRTCIT